MQLISNVEVTNKNVLVRMDLDVLVEKGVVTDDFRLQAGLPTLRYLIEGGAAAVTVIGHRGRPKGKETPKLSVKAVVEHLQNLLGQSFRWKENLRFDPRETGNVPVFAQQLAENHDLYINEAFAAAHRAHASIVGVPQHLPAYAGIRFAKEVKQLKQVRENPKRPLIFIIGGGKTDKIKYVKAFGELADKILLGGVLMFKKSLEGVPKVRFPVDSVKHYDIGPRSVNLFKKQLVGAKTVVWNGPLGRFEEEEYEAGTREIGESLAHMATQQDVNVIVGGGDTLAALKKFNLRDKMSFTSTGGGAMLKLLAKGELPGLNALNT